eukprot:c4995_g1_i2 orf=1-198(-)
MLGANQKLPNLVEKTAIQCPQISSTGIAKRSAWLGLGLRSSRKKGRNFGSLKQASSEESQVDTPFS